MLTAPHARPVPDASGSTDRPQAAPDDAPDWGPDEWDLLTPGERQELIEMGRRRFHPLQHHAAREYAEQIDSREP